jgi:hypothetical protein
VAKCPYRYRACALQSRVCCCLVLGIFSRSWVQMDLGSSKYVAQIVTRGRADDAILQWVTQYKVQHSTDGITFTEVPSVFTGNSDYNTKVYATLPEPVLARYVRVVPTSWSGHACMRVAVVLTPGFFRTSCQTWHVARAQCQAHGGTFVLRTQSALSWLCAYTNSCHW